MTTRKTAATAAGKKKPPAKKRKAKPKKEEPTKEERVGAVVNQLKSDYPGKVFRGREYTAPWMLKRLPTGILELDIELNGGLPAGGFTMIYGKEGIGKNWLTNQVLANQQSFLGDMCAIAVISTEMIYDKSLAKACKVYVGFSGREISAMDRAYFDWTGEHLDDEYVADLKTEVGTFLTVPPTTAEKAFDIALDIIASGEFDVVVIDSFGSLLTAEDENKDMDDKVRVGGASGVNTRFMRKLVNAMAPDDEGHPNMTCVIGINQLRDNMDRKNEYSPKTKESGGWAIKHIRWVGIELTSAGWAKEKVDKKELVVGKAIGWKITKQKAGGHEGARGDYDFIWKSVGIRRAKESLKTAAKFGIVTKAGSWYSYEGTRIGQGLNNAAKFVEENELLPELEVATLLAAGVRCNYLYDRDAD